MHGTVPVLPHVEPHGKEHVAIPQTTYLDRRSLNPYDTARTSPCWSYLHRPCNGCVTSTAASLPQKLLCIGTELKSCAPRALVPRGLASPECSNSHYSPSTLASTRPRPITPISATVIHGKRQVLRMLTPAIIHHGTSWRQVRALPPCTTARGLRPSSKCDDPTCPRTFHYHKHIRTAYRYHGNTYCWWSLQATHLTSCITSRPIVTCHLTACIPKLLATCCHPWSAPCAPAR